MKSPLSHIVEDAMRLVGEHSRPALEDQADW